MNDSQKISILLIEDNPCDARLLQEVLSEDTAGQWEVTPASSLAEAVKMFRPGRYHAVLLDLQLPDTQGVDTFYALRRQIRDIPIIVISGLDDQDLAVQAVQKGAQEYLVKGIFDSQGALAGRILGRIIRHAIARHEVLSTMKKDRRLERRLAYYDTLTRLPNRYLFYDRLSAALTQAKRTHQRLAVFFLDLNGFKQINDTYGHGIGDLLLQSLAVRLKGCMRSGDTLARLSGDEFTVIVNAVASLTHVVKIAQKIMRSLAGPFVFDKREIFVTVSIGISLFPWDGTDRESLIRNADIAMYRAKGEDRNNYEFFGVPADLRLLNSGKAGEP